jgi:hypothetical protein
MTDKTDVLDKTTEALCPVCGKTLADGHHHNQTEPAKSELASTNGHHHNQSEPAEASAN